jgi:YebC/PmpR family DNA-binding regulatory protein
MSGHSKWSTIKRKKGLEDQKRGQLFTKLGRSITLAVREGGGNEDPTSNFKLRLAMDRAKQFNMPKENIKRAIERGTGKGGEGNTFERIIYEGYGPEGIALIIEVATDNRMRSTSEVKYALDRNGGSIGSPGSVSFQFEQQGVIVISKESVDEEKLFLEAVEAGALDVKTEDDGYEVFTNYDDLHVIKEKLEKAGFTIVEADIIYHPKTHVLIDPAKAGKIINLMDQLEELDDVQKVYANFDITG